MAMYSFSQLETFSRCPRQYQFQYVEKPEVTERTSVKIYLGNAVHRILEQLHKAANFERLPDKETLLAEYEAFWETEGAKTVVVDDEHQTIDDYKLMGRRAIERYYDSFALQPFGKSLLVEGQLTLNFGSEATHNQITFRAKVDRLWRREDGVVEIADFKTGTSFSAAESDRFRRQMGIYQLAVQSKWPELTPVEVVQHFLVLGEAVPYRFQPEQLDELEEELRDNVREILHARAHSIFPTNEGGHCRWCQYEKLCPVKRYRQALESEAGSGTSGEIPTTSKLAELAVELFALKAKEKGAKDEYGVIRELVIRYAKELGLSSVPTPLGNVSIYRKYEEKFPTKTDSPREVAEVQALIRSWGFDDYLIVDLKAFLKDLVAKKRLTESQRTALEPYLIAGENVTVKAMRRKLLPSDDEAASGAATTSTPDEED